MTEAECAEALAERIRKRAAARGWSIEQLADFAAVSRSGLWAILAGERLPSVRFLLQLANALGCKPSALLP